MEHAERVTAIEARSPTMGELGEAARRYRAAGLSAVPLIARSKQIDFSKLRRSGMINAFGFATYAPFATEAPSDRHLDTWFETAANLGIVVGPDVVVLDFDVDGTYEAWSRAHPQIAGRTPTQHTSRGHHVVLRIDERPCSSKAVVGGRIVGDVVTSQRWLVVWPSLHPSGRRYEWGPGLAPWQCEMARVSSLAAVGIGQEQRRNARHRCWVVVRCLVHPRRFVRRVRLRGPQLPGWPGD